MLYLRIKFMWLVGVTLLVSSPIIKGADDRAMFDCILFQICECGDVGFYVDCFSKAPEMLRNRTAFALHDCDLGFLERYDPPTIEKISCSLDRDIGYPCFSEAYNAMKNYERETSRDIRRVDEKYEIENGKMKFCGIPILSTLFKKRRGKYTLSKPHHDANTNVVLVNYQKLQGNFELTQRLPWLQTSMPKYPTTTTF
ncbi:uncharacterized protein LOC129220251 [Uloborus diversus]|uniref:uncharacterized protein LOC129220251 n=1 Tax=Uloborus diversus TaxID=327109 RepID=UPI00240A14FF|nr:uncharacterized protein LOC129220251 [Uloborus diversus]